MFQVNTDDLKFLFESAGQPVLINNVERQAIITNPSLSDNEERLIHTIETVSQGDIVTIEDEQFVCISETVTKRHGKNKAKIRHCNFIIRIAGEIEEVFLGNDSYGRPVYQEIEGEPYLIPSFVDYKSFSIIAGQIAVAENQIFVTVQDNEVTKDKLKVNNTFELIDGDWKIRNVDKTKRGLLLLTCEKVI